MTDDRLLLIADLSGYTAYLVGGEAEEAPLIAGDLVETIVTHLTGDFEVAVQEGATLIRVGTALFGPRPHLARRDVGK